MKEFNDDIKLTASIGYGFIILGRILITIGEVDRSAPKHPISKYLTPSAHQHYPVSPRSHYPLPGNLALDHLPYNQGIVV